MQDYNCVALVTGGASGLGEATAKMLYENGARVAILDVHEEMGARLESELGNQAIFVKTDITDEISVQSALDLIIDKFAKINVVVNCAGVAGAQKVFGRNGPMALDEFNRIIQVNLIGTVNVIRLAVAKMVQNTPNNEGERGVIINTASAAATDGQIGQAAYSASKGGIVSMTLPIARELAAHGIRVVTISPGLFETPMLTGMPAQVLDALGKMVPFPPRLGRPFEYAMLVQEIIRNPMLNGTTIRLDGAIRMQPK